MGRHDVQAGSSFNLIALAPGLEGYDHLHSALQDRRVELIDEMVSVRRDRVSLVALVAPGGRTSVFVSKNQAFGGAPDLQDAAAAFQRLLSRGRYQEGAALVLGRSRSHPGDYAGDYPSLLRFLSSSEEGDRRRSCADGIAGIQGDAPSLVSSLLWWELARASAVDPGQDTVNAVVQALAGFRRLSAGWQASQASRVRRLVEQSMQHSFLHAPPPLDMARLRFEVVPTLLVSCDAVAEKDWTVAAPGQSLGWRHLGCVVIRLDGAFEPDFGTTPLALRDLALFDFGDGTVEVRVAVDFAARIALGVERPSRQERLRYSVRSELGEVATTNPFASAGEMVGLLCDQASILNSATLTCTSTLGHFAEFDLGSGVEGVFSNAKRRNCDSSRPAIAAA